MKKRLTIVLLLGGVLSTGNICAQSNCLQQVTYKTSSVGNGKESLPFALLFIIKNDTLRIANNEMSANASDNVPYLITEKNCNWNASYTEGNAFYRLMLNDKGEVKHPTLTIDIKEKKGKIILQFENSEPRVFEMIL